MYYRLGTKWRAFLEALGREVVVSPASDRGVFERGQALSVDECCLASKLYLGHVAALAASTDAVLVPSLALPGPLRAYCTKFQALPDLVTNAFALADVPVRGLSELLWEGGTEKDERESYVRLGARLGAPPQGGRPRLEGRTPRSGRPRREARAGPGQARLCLRQAPDRIPPAHDPGGRPPLRGARPLRGRRRV